MMRLTVCETVDAQAWDSKIGSLKAGIIHSSAYAKYVLAGQPNASPRYVTLTTEGGECVGAALGFQTRSSHKLLGPLTGRFWLAGTPVVAGDVEDCLLEFLRQLEAYARGEGHAELEIGSSASFHGRQELEELGFSLTHRLEFELGLEPSEEDLWRNMKPKRRKNIKRAIRTGVTVEDLPGEEGIAELRRLQGDSSERIMARGGPDIAQRSGSSDDPVGVLLDCGLGRLVCAKVDGQVESVGLFTHFNGLVYHTLSGHSQKALETQAPTLLLWETIKRYRSEGAERLNFGGCKADAIQEGGPEHGVYVYKMAFGAECKECTSGRKVLRKVTYGLVRAARKVLHA